jgi:hypothetical protein
MSKPDGLPITPSSSRKENVMLDMAILINELLKVERQKRRDPMADPLEGAEWQGLLWTLRLFDLFSGERRTQTPEKDRSQTSFRHGTAQCETAR